MEILRYIFLVLLIVMSLVGAVLTVKDKLAAKRRKVRVPERALMAAGLFGGALVMLAVMLVIRHKTRHVKFMLGLPLFVILHAAAAYFLFF